MRLFLLALFLATLYLGTQVLFPVEKVEVVGLRHLKEAEVLALTGLRPGEGWLFIGERRLKALRAHPWVRKAHLEKPAPGRIRVRVEERVPFLPLADGSALAEDGTLLPQGAPWARGPRVLGEGPIPVETVLTLARAFPGAQAIRYTPAGFYIEWEEVRLFAPEASLLLGYGRKPEGKGQISLYSWGVSARP